MDKDNALSLQPIGFLRTRQRVKFQAGHQPSAATEVQNELELRPDAELSLGLQDLAGFSHLWLIWWFHRNTTWRPLVLPPRGPAQRRGVFATRSPHRPNPIGLTCVPLLKIEGPTLFLGPCDLIDGTPVLDLKPYIPAYDSFPEAKAGWIDELESEAQGPAPYTLAFAPLAVAQADWLLHQWSVDFRPRLEEILTRDPSPHRTRRIRNHPTREREIGCGAWRAYFSVRERTVTVSSLGPAYPLTFLTRESYRNVPDRAAQLSFLAAWPHSARDADTPPELGAV